MSLTAEPAPKKTAHGLVRRGFGSYEGFTKNTNDSAETERPKRKFSQPPIHENIPGSVRIRRQQFFIEPKLIDYLKRSWRKLETVWPPLDLIPVHVFGSNDSAGTRTGFEHGRIDPKLFQLPCA